MSGKPGWPREMMAFPAQFSLTDGDTTHECAQFGMSLRQHYAGLAMQGLLAAGPLDAFSKDVSQALAEYAVDLADALLAELAKPKEGA